MTRQGYLAVSLGIAIVSLSLSLVLYTLAELTPLQALLCGASLAVLLGLSQRRAWRDRERASMSDVIDSLRADNLQLQNELVNIKAELPALAEAARRAEAAERSVGALLDEALGPALDQRISRQVETGKATLVGEMRVIEGLVKQIAENQPRVRPAESAPALPAQAPRQLLAPSNDAGTLQSRVANAELLARVRHAMAENRIEIFLQPIVTLPQRKVRYYEALVRLRDAEGDPILPEDYLRVAGDAGLMPVLDNLLLLRSSQIVRQMTKRNGQFTMFCNLSLETLGDPDHFPQFADYLEQNRTLREHLVFELGQAALKKAGPLEQDSLATLRELGFRFSLDHVEALDIDARELSQRGFKFVKIGADLLLDGGLTVKTHIHPADMGSLLGRYSIQLIAEKVETETEVVNLLDLDLSLGQGYLFAEPKQVRIGNANLQDLLAARKAG